MRPRRSELVADGLRSPRRKRTSPLDSDYTVISTKQQT